MIRSKPGLPIGLVDTSWGGSIASAWCSRDALSAISEAAKMLKKKDAAADAWSEAGARQQLAAALADREKRAAAAKAEVVSRTSVALWSDKGADPVHVRYAWSGIPFCHLCTESGLPVGPFRTDDFPTTSAPR